MIKNTQTLVDNFITLNLFMKIEIWEYLLGAYEWHKSIYSKHRYQCHISIYYLIINTLRLERVVYRITHKLYGITLIFRYL